MQLLDLRCSCSHNTLLGVFNIDEDGEVFLHIKSWKQSKTLVNCKIFGVVEIMCRNCNRYTRVNPRRVSSQEIDNH